MADLEDLPLVALENLLPRLDRESLIAASKVCVSWKKIVHDFTSRRISNVNFDLKEKLAKCGWIMNEHDVERCSCIDLNSSLFKFIGNVPLSCRDLFNTPKRFSRKPIFALSKSKLFFSDDYNVVEVFDLKQETMEPIELWKGRDIEEIKAMHLHDKTLALIEFDWFAPPRIYILNHETSQFVQRLNENSFKVAMGLTQEEFRTHKIFVFKIALAEDKLAVLLRIRIGFLFESVSYQTQIWKLYTAEPSTANIQFWKTISIDHDIDEDDDSFTQLFMNSKLLCLAIYNRRLKKLVLDVLLFDDLSRQTITVFEDIVNGWDAVIEDNCSQRVSVFENKSFILKIYEFDGANVSCLEVNLSQYAKDSRVMRLNRFMMGKVMLFLYSDGIFQCILVTEDGAVVEGTNQQLKYPHLVHPLQRPHQLHVSADGIVAVMCEMDLFKGDYKLYFYN